MENLYDHGFLIIYCMIQGTKKKIDLMLHDYH